MSVSHGMYHKWYSKKEGEKMITVSIIKVIALVLSSFSLGMAITNAVYTFSWIRKK